jgi:hypothetical protein
MNHIAAAAEEKRKTRIQVSNVDPAVNRSINHIPAAAEEKRKTRFQVTNLDPAVNRSRSHILSQERGVQEWLACLELHLTADGGKNNANRVDYFLKALAQLQDDIHLEGQTRNVIRWALVAMHQYPSSAIIQARCFYLLLLFPAQYFPLPNRCVKYILAAMRNHPKCEEVQCWGCQLLECLLECYRSQVFTTFNAEGGLEYVFAACRKFSIDMICKRIFGYVQEIAQHHSSSAGPNKSSMLLTPTKHQQDDMHASLDILHAGIVALRLSVLESHQHCV